MLLGVTLILLIFAALTAAVTGMVLGEAAFKRLSEEARNWSFLALIGALLVSIGVGELAAFVAAFAVMCFFAGGLFGLGLGPMETRRQ